MTEPQPRRKWRPWVLAAVLIAAWLPYGLLTYWWYSLGMDEGFRGEVYGPVSYFRPRARWLGLAATVAVTVALLWPRRQNP